MTWRLPPSCMAEDSLRLSSALIAWSRTRGCSWFTRVAPSSWAWRTFESQITGASVLQTQKATAGFIT